MKHYELPYEVRKNLQKGVVIPALPLALDENRQLDTLHQKALMRYYLNAGAGGVAVGVHTTQFEIRDPKINLYQEILSLAKDEFDLFCSANQKEAIRIAGVIGRTRQATKEAELARANGYHAVLLSLSAFAEAKKRELINHCKTIADIIPVIGFYLQPAVGGRKLNIDFWREFTEIKNVIAIKIAPFNRYETLDVVRAAAESGRADEIALYTGNDDNILADLLTEYHIQVGEKIISKRIVGGLLGHWAVWTRSAVRLLEDVHAGKYNRDTQEALKIAIQITDSNAAFFDAANNFKGCITGIHEVLRRQGLLKGIWTLNKNDVLSPGQKEEIDRVIDSYPHLNDDEFVSANIKKWLS